MPYEELPLKQYRHTVERMADQDVGQITKLWVDGKRIEGKDNGAITKINKEKIDGTLITKNVNKKIKVK